MQTKYDIDWGALAGLKNEFTDPVHFPLIRKIFDLMVLLRALTAARCELLASSMPFRGVVWGNAMPTSHQAYRHTRLEGLFDHANPYQSPTMALTIFDDYFCV